MPSSRWADWVEPDDRPTNLVPLFPVSGFRPDSPCPHNRPIRDGSDFVCMCKHCVSNLKSAILSRAVARPPIEPERRVAWLAKALKDGVLAGKAAEDAREQIARLRALVDAPSEPTRYRPDGRLKGGLS